MKLIIPSENTALVIIKDQEVPYKFRLGSNETLSDAFNDIVARHPNWTSMIITIHSQEAEIKPCLTTE